MGKVIHIRVGSVAAKGELDDSASAQAVYRALHVTAQVRTWGEEIYFEIAVDCPPEGDARCEMSVGEMAYWPPGKALCIFFGPTPASDSDGTPRAAGKVNPVGKIIGDPEVFQTVRDGQEITLTPQG